jgi:hypothetical protein
VALADELLLSLGDSEESCRAEAEEGGGFLGWIRADDDEDDDDDDEDEDEDDNEASIIASATPRPPTPSWLRKYKDSSVSPRNTKSPPITTSERYAWISLTEMVDMYNSSSFALI